MSTYLCTLDDTGYKIFVYLVLLVVVLPCLVGKPKALEIKFHLSLHTNIVDFGIDAEGVQNYE